MTAWVAATRGRSGRRSSRGGGGVGIEGHTSRRFHVAVTQRESMKSGWRGPTLPTPPPPRERLPMQAAAFRGVPVSFFSEPRGARSARSPHPFGTRGTACCLFRNPGMSFPEFRRCGTRLGSLGCLGARMIHLRVSRRRPFRSVRVARARRCRRGPAVASAQGPRAESGFGRPCRSGNTRHRSGNRALLPSQGSIVRAMRIVWVIAVAGYVPDRPVDESPR